MNLDETAVRGLLHMDDVIPATERALADFSTGGVVQLVPLVTPSEDLAPGKVTISVKAEGSGDNTSEIDAVDTTYLQDARSALEGQVALETTSPSAPGVLRPVGLDNYIHVVMPMFAQW